VIAMQEVPRLDSLPAFLVPGCHKKTLHTPDEEPSPELSKAINSPIVAPHICTSTSSLAQNEERQYHFPVA